MKPSDVARPRGRCMTYIPPSRYLTLTLRNNMDLRLISDEMYPKAEEV